jgi:hypothetical protein
MAKEAGERAARGADAASERIRDLNEQVLERIRSGGESALERMSGRSSRQTTRRWPASTAASG